MRTQISGVVVGRVVHRVLINHTERLRPFYGRFQKWSATYGRDRMLQYRTRWMIWAMCFAPLSYVIPATANIGTAEDVTAGLTTCINNGTLGPLASPAGSWGGKCDIPLSARAFAPSVHLPGIANVSGSLQAWLSWPGAPAGYGVSLRLTNALTITCQGVGRYTWYSGTVIPLNTLVKNNGSNNSGVGCSYAKYAPPTFPTDVMLDKNDVKYSGSVGGVLTMTISVPAGSALIYPALNLTFDTSYPDQYTMMSLAVAGSGGLNPTPPNPPVAGTPPNCTAITGVASTNYDFGRAEPGIQAGVLNTSGTVPPHNLTLSCTAGTGGNIAAKATMYVQTSSSLSSDRLSLLDSAKPNDWLGLQLAFPAAMPAGVSKDINQKNTVVTWTAGQTVPLWAWSIPAQTGAGAISLPMVSLQPQIKQLVAAPTAVEGTRTYHVTYSAVIQ
ncbi:hypothetical protein GA0061070_106517 [Kosakonia oryziphila]|uniref:Uncharacterized protein n=1 Tax=Kosakonia oryziphila TaxID=1005667 RepID=A0A1C4GGT0_9ENTR|nr:hypothetical protein GA0061070_106517 [Kosakonia oryziphila]